MHKLITGETVTAVINAIGGAFTDPQNHGDDGIVGQFQDLINPPLIKALHRAGIVPLSGYSEHKVLSDELNQT